MTEEASSHRLANDPAMPKPGDLIGGRYRIESLLGEGGFAAVFKAFDTTTTATVAVKVLDPLMSRRDEFAQRFQQEVKTAGGLKDDNTIRVTDSGEINNENGSSCLFLVMELLDGHPLDSLIEERGPVPVNKVKQITLGVLRSLREAHKRNIIHRDIKPANVFIVATDGEEDKLKVKVLDFGIAKSMDGTESAKLTSTGQVMCSPHYVAPERIVDHLTVPASDLYSLGISMIEMLEGKPPYDADNPLQLVMKHAHPNEAVPMAPETRNGPLGDIIAKATDKNWRTRYQSAQEMIDDLKALDGLSTPGVSTQVHQMRPSGVQPLASTGELPSSNRGWLLGFIAFLVAAVVTTAVWAAFFRTSASSTSDATTSQQQTRPEKQPPQPSTNDELAQEDLPDLDPVRGEETAPDSETEKKQPSTTRPRDDKGTDAIDEDRSHAKPTGTSNSPTKDTPSTDSAGDTTAQADKAHGADEAGSQGAVDRPAHDSDTTAAPSDDTTKKSDDNTKTSPSTPKDDHKDKPAHKSESSSGSEQKPTKPIEIPDFGSGGYGGSKGNDSYFGR